MPVPDGPEMDENCEPKVEIDPSGLSATLVLPAPFERMDLTQEYCLSVLQSANIDTEAIDQDKLDAFIADALAAPPGPFQGVVAEGTPAVDGIDAYVDWLIDEPNSTADTSPQDAEPDGDRTDEQADEDEPVCFYSQCVYTVVKTGDILGKAHPEMPGIDGKDVLGQPLVAKGGKPLDLKHDESIQFQDSKTLIAQIDGILIHDTHLAWVSGTLEIDSNVDFSTGNIDFPGSVLVKQGVKDCFTVQARKDIEVRSLIEAATIIAGKDLHTKGGFAGREQGRAEVQGNLYGKYLDAVTAQVGEDLCVEREIINCNCTVLGNIDSPRGSLIGGCTYVSGTVQLQELGASAQPITELHIGALPMLDPLIAELDSFVSRCVERRAEMLEEQEMITANSGARVAPTHEAKLREIARVMGKLQLLLDRAEPSLERVTERAESIRKIDVLVSRRVHPNTLLVCGLHRYRIVNEIKGPVRITVNKRGQLEYRQGEGEPRLLSEECDYKSAA